MSRPTIDSRAPADAVDETVQHVLALATTWTVWDGHERLADGRTYTPHKAIRRVADHLIDHLAQLEAHLAGVPSLRSAWRGSAVTTDADRAAFTPDDLQEATARLLRLAHLWRLALSRLPAGARDVADGDAYTPREMAFCAVESTYYADVIGDLSPTPA